jgi:hypothetical protein
MRDLSFSRYVLICALHGIFHGDTLPVISITSKKSLNGVVEDVFRMLQSIVSPSPSWHISAIDCETQCPALRSSFTGNGRSLWYYHSIVDSAAVLRLLHKIALGYRIESSCADPRPTSWRPWTNGLFIGRDMRNEMFGSLVELASDWLPLCFLS